MGLLGPGRGMTFFVAALLGTAWVGAALVYLVHARSQSIFLGYQLAHARAAKSNLFEENCQLQLEARIWQTPERLQLAAARDLGLKPPAPSQARFLPDVRPEGHAAPQARMAALPAGSTGAAPATGLQVTAGQDAHAPQLDPGLAPREGASRRQAFPGSPTAAYGLEPTARGLEPTARGLEPAARRVEPAARGLQQPATGPTLAAIDRGALPPARQRPPESVTR